MANTAGTKANHTKTSRKTQHTSSGPGTRRSNNGIIKKMTPAQLFGVRPNWIEDFVLFNWHTGMEYGYRVEQLESYSPTAL